MEEIREARRQEAEARQDHRKSAFEDTKDSLRRGRNKKSKPDAEPAVKDDDTSKSSKKNKKRVSFG
jgi:60S ribosomal subunit assembly/export protein LOC1